MTVVPLARNADQLRSLLEDIALGRGGDANETAVRALAWPGHIDETFLEAWDDFRLTVRAREALATGVAIWRDFYEPEECGGTEHAIELKTIEADDAYAVLMRGPRRLATAGDPW